ncbi:MAG: hypothetical protein Q9165_008304 [Trypethelium subeluteriae]
MGTRPLPWLRASASKSELETQDGNPNGQSSGLEESQLPPRSMSALSLRNPSSERLGEKHDSHAGRALVQQPSGKPMKRQASGESKEGNEERKEIPYVENGQRWMERQESRSVTMALRDMDLKAEKKLHAAAQDEASELVWKHQNPGAPYRNLDAAKYKEHLRRGSHARAHSTERPTPLPHSDLQSEPDPISYSTNERHSGQSSRLPSDPSLKAPPISSQPAETNGLSKEDTTVPVNSFAKKPYSGLAQSVARDISTHRRTSSGSKRKVSRETGKSTFKNPDDQIYEEPEEIQKAKIADPRPPPVPLSMRRNPFARVKFAQQEKHERSNSEPILNAKKFDRFEIHKNPPSQSRNPEYTSNTSTPPKPLTQNDDSLVGHEDSPRTKDGKEVRGDDIRAATSMKIKDRSPKLPTPSAVSDKPGRPIVSFDPNWKPKEIELEEEMSKAIPRSAQDSKAEPKVERPSPMPIKAATTIGIPTLNILDVASRERAHSPPPAIHNDTMEMSIVVPSINVDGPPQVPIINEPDPSSNPSYSHPQAPLTRSHTTPVPLINLPDEPRSVRQQTLPTISIADEPGPTPRPPSIPIINIQDQPRPSNKQRPLPTINAPSNSAASKSPRPLPTIHTPNNSKPPSSSRSIPTINTPSPAPPHPKPSTRPLPQPSATPSRPNPLRHAHTTTSAINTRPSPAPHWTPSTRRTQAQCAQCALPIAGRIVSAASQRFHPECFTCHHCGEGLECVAFYPEPDGARAARLDRIARRAAGEVLEEGPTEMEDGYCDDVGGQVGGGGSGGGMSLRFYCHLDFHEMFSPRCKSCHTPIEGEVVVACGAEWHVGHFFCAQCGDPFDAQMPFVERDGYAWCVGCHTNRYSAKCRKCRRPVTEVVVKALGAEWHQECFVCVVSFLLLPFFLRYEALDREWMEAN